MNIKQLRKDHPSWTWVAKSEGYNGLAYFGVRGDRSVRVANWVEYATCEMSWSVHEGPNVTRFDAWSAKDENR